MEVNPTAETATRQPVNPAKKNEGPKDPSKRRLLTGGLNVLKVVAAGAVLGDVGLAAWPKVDQFLKTLAPTPTSAPVKAIPTLLPIESDKPPAEKKINNVKLADITEKQGLMIIVPTPSVPTSAENPYGFSLYFQDLTIVAVEKNSNDNSVWVAVAMSGKDLTREDTGRSAINFDKTTTEEYIYKGFTAWVLVDNGVIVTHKGSNQGAIGLGALGDSLSENRTISFNVGMNQGNKIYQEMNANSFQLLSNSLGKSNADRSDQSFIFRTSFVNLD